MKTFAALLAVCVGNSPDTGDSPSQRPMTQSFDVFFDLRLNIRLSKQSWSLCFDTRSRSLWRHCNGAALSNMGYPSETHLKPRFREVSLAHKFPWEKNWPPWLLTVSSQWAHRELTLTKMVPTSRDWAVTWAVTELWPSRDWAVIILRMPWLSCDLAVTELWPSRDWAVTSPWLSCDIS